MNKLVSRNPIQRFKQGRKIVKAQFGTTVRQDGVIVNRIGVPIGHISSLSYNRLRSLEPNSIANGTYYETKDSSRKVIEKGRYFGGKKHSLPLGDSSNVKTINNPQDLYQKKLNQGVQIFGKKKNNKVVNNNKNIKNIENFEIPPVDTSEVINIPQIQEVSGLYSNIHPKDEVFNVKQIENLPSSRKFYNKAEVRDYIRRHGNGKGAYSFTADYRKALRKVLNGQGTEQDLNMVKAMGLDSFKVGGILPSKNIIERFKNRINKN